MKTVVIILEIFKVYFTHFLYSCVPVLKTSSLCCVKNIVLNDIVEPLLSFALPLFVFSVEYMSIVGVESKHTKTV